MSDSDLPCASRSGLVASFASCVGRTHRPCGRLDDRDLAGSHRAVEVVHQLLLLLVRREGEAIGRIRRFEHPSSLTKRAAVNGGREEGELRREDEVKATPYGDEGILCDALAVQCLFDVEMYRGKRKKRDECLFGREEEQGQCLSRRVWTTTKDRK